MVFVIAIPSFLHFFPRPFVIWLINSIRKQRGINRRNLYGLFVLVLHIFSNPIQYAFIFGFCYGRKNIFERYSIHLIEEHLPIGYEITIMATLKFIRIDCPYKGTYRQPVYDYNVVNVVDRNSNRQLSMEEIIDICGKTKLRAPDFEVGEYMFLSLGEMFKSFESFKKYVRECDKDHYELIAFRATQEIR